MDEVANANGDVVSRYPGKGVPHELLPTRLDGIEDAIRGGGIVRGDVKPDADQVFVGALGTND